VVEWQKDISGRGRFPETRSPEKDRKTKIRKGRPKRKKFVKGLQSNTEEGKTPDLLKKTDSEEKKK